MEQFAEVSRESRAVKLAILVNTIAPYRVPMYASLATSFKTLVLHGGREANRSWTLDLPPALKTQRVWTVQIPVRKRMGVAGIRDTQYLHFNLGLLWWLPRFRPDAILTNELGLRTAIALLYGWLAKVPVWVQWEGTLHSERHVSGWKRRLRSFLTRHIQRWISYGASSSEYLLSLGAPPERLLEVQNCVPQENFLHASATGSEWFPETPGPVILSVGQFIPRKGLNKLIDACGRLSARGVPFTLALVGSGPERDRLQTQAARAGIKHFFLIANQSQKALNELYRRANVFVFPTLEDVWGLVVNEALWAGLPVLCSKYAGCAEIVPAENLFDPLSDESFDQALEKVLEERVKAPDVELLMSWQEVTGVISSSILKGASPGTEPRGSGEPEPIAPW
ncbi:MAG: glycosyltransferase [Janthinobacterium lividum]